MGCIGGQQGAPERFFIPRRVQKPTVRCPLSNAQKDFALLFLESLKLGCTLSPIFSILFIENPNHLTFLSVIVIKLQYSYQIFGRLSGVVTSKRRGYFETVLQYKNPGNNFGWSGFESHRVPPAQSSFQRPWPSLRSSDLDLMLYLYLYICTYDNTSSKAQSQPLRLLSCRFLYFAPWHYCNQKVIMR